MCFGFSLLRALADSSFASSSCFTPFLSQTLITPAGVTFRLRQDREALFDAVAFFDAEGKKRAGVCNMVVNIKASVDVIARHYKFSLNRWSLGLCAIHSTVRAGCLPETPFFYYRGDQLAACRIGEWKAHFFTQAGYGQPNAEQHDPPLLFHLGLDPSEKRNVAAEHPDVIARIQSAVKVHQSAVVSGKPQLQ